MHSTARLEAVEYGPNLGISILEMQITVKNGRFNLFWIHFAPVTGDSKHSVNGV